MPYGYGYNPQSGCTYHNRVFSCDVITFEIMKENRKQPPFWCTTQIGGSMVIFTK